jgi:phosphoglycerate dehydrogenase-like enzyme
MTTPADVAPAPAPAPAPVHVLVTLDFPESFIERVRGVDGRVVVHHHPGGEDDDPVDVVPSDVLAAAEVMYTSAVLPGRDTAPALRWAQLDTSGIDHVRGTALWHSDCVITTLGGVSPAPLAEWIIMMVLVHAHHLRTTERLAATHTWPSRDDRWNRLMPHNLRTSTIGIVGYGRIGKEVARIARALGMDVLALRRGSSDGSSDRSSDRSSDGSSGGATSAPPTEQRFGASGEVEGVTELPASQLHDLLTRSDYVALTVPLTPQTEGMIGAAEIAAMKPTAVLVNGSRGGVVDEAALLAALERGHLDLVSSDVFDAEPLPADHPFWSHERFVVTPHVAGFAPDYLDVVGTLFTDNLGRYLHDSPLLNVADRERGY